MYKYGFLFIGIFVFINLVLYPLLINTQFSRFGYLLGIGPGIAIINLLGIFGIHPILTKLVLASIYSLCVYFLFGAALGSIIEYSKKLKKKTKNKKKLKKNKSLKKLKKKQKGQVSLEIIIILSILIIVGIIVGIVYFSIISKDSAQASMIVDGSDTITDPMENDPFDYVPIDWPTGLIINRKCETI
jgi:H+/gluconate symporter-like permease